MTDRTDDRFEGHDTDHGPGYAKRSSSPTSGTASRTTVRDVSVVGSHSAALDDGDLASEPGTHAHGGAGPARVRAQRGDPLTVLRVPQPSNLATHRQRAATVRGYRGLGGALHAAVLDDEANARVSPLTLVSPRPASPPIEFPIAPVARLVDDSNRVRPCLDVGSTRDLLGWAPGVLESTVIDGWLVLRQQPGQVGAARGRNSVHAGFTVTDAGLERICLRRGHLQALDAAPGTTLLLAALPEQAALVLVNPVRLMSSGAPNHVRALIEPDCTN